MSSRTRTRGRGRAGSVAALVALAQAASVAAGSPALADETEETPERLPISHAERPLTLPRLVVAPEVRFDVSTLDQGTGQTGIELRGFLYL